MVKDEGQRIKDKVLRQAQDWNTAQKANYQNIRKTECRSK